MAKIEFEDLDEVAEDGQVICTGPSRLRHRSRTISRLTCSGVRCGLRRGREDRSAIPAAPSVRYRLAHLAAVRGETMNIFAAAE